MKKIMLLANNKELINKVESMCNNVLVYDNFMEIFEQLNFHNPSTIIFDFNLIKHEEQFMLESLPKRNEDNYIELIAVGSCPVKEKMTDFNIKFKDSQSFCLY